MWRSLGQDENINLISFDDVDISIIEKTQNTLNKIRKIQGLHRRASSDSSLFMHMV